MLLIVSHNDRTYSYQGIKGVHFCFSMMEYVLHVLIQVELWDILFEHCLDLFPNIRKCLEEVIIISSMVEIKQ